MADTKHAVIRTDAMAGTDVRDQLISVKYMGSDGDTATAIDNGNIVKVGGLVDGERNIFVGSAPADGDTIKDLAVIASEEIDYEHNHANLEDFQNEAGATCRGYRLHSGSIFSVTAEAIEGTKTVGDSVEISAGSTKLNTVGTATAASIGKLIAIETASRFTYYVIQID